jgi:hypothetical protein
MNRSTRDGVCWFSNIADMIVCSILKRESKYEFVSFYMIGKKEEVCDESSRFNTRQLVFVSSPNNEMSCKPSPIPEGECQVEPVSETYKHVNMSICLHCHECQSKQQKQTLKDTK